jgi:signal transduction histidine kinase
VDLDNTPEVLFSMSVTNKEYIIAVKDNGIGIAKEHQNKIFRISERLHSLEEYPGTGIGLAIAEKAVQLHGGQL